MGFWNDSARTPTEREEDEATRRVRRAIGLTAVFGDQGRGLGCYAAFSPLTEEPGIKLRTWEHYAFVPWSAFKPNMSYAEIREVLAKACPELADMIRERRAPEEDPKNSSPK